MTKDFEYLGIINDVPMTLIGKPTLAPNNYKELAAYLNKERTRSTWPMPVLALPRTSAACCCKAP